MAHPDLSIVAPEEPSGSIKVDQIRDLQHGLYLAPYQADRRLALLLDFERANTNAANALLKTLEEPPATVVLLLTATDAEALLPTVASRCETIRLQPVPLPLLEQSLVEREEAEPASARMAAHLAGGRPGLALQFLREPHRLDQHRARLDDHSRLLGANRLIRFSYADDLAKSGDGIQQTLQAWLNFWRDVLLQAAGARSPLTNPDRESEIEALAARLGASRAVKVIDSIENTLTLLNGNTNPRLAIEVLMLDLPKI
jgi:DNA polymerase-3 subunit delta'